MPALGPCLIDPEEEVRAVAFKALTMFLQVYTPSLLYGPPTGTTLTPLQKHTPDIHHTHLTDTTEAQRWHARVAQQARPAASSTELGKRRTGGRGQQERDSGRGCIWMGWVGYVGGYVGCGVSGFGGGERYEGLSVLCVECTVLL